jgi:hypothetical protein
MTAAVDVIIKNAKTAQDKKTARLREQRLARDAAATPEEAPQTKKKRTSKAIPVDKLTSENDT